MRFLVVLAVAAVGCVPLSATAWADTSDAVAVERRAALELQVVQELNRVRVARGLAPVRNVEGLRSAAVAHSQSMLRLGFFAHESADGTEFDDRIRRHYPAKGWATWTVGETLLSNSGEIGARRIVSVWLASPPHREILLSATWREIGVGALYRPAAGGVFGGLETVAVTADFGYRAGRRNGS